MGVYILEEGIGKASQPGREIVGMGGCMRLNPASGGRWGCCICWEDQLAILGTQAWEDSG